MTDYTEAAVAPAEAAIDEALKNGSAPEGVETRLLTLYSFYPHLMRPEYVLKTAMFALMKLPSTDFSACLPLIPDAQLAKEPLSVLVEADTLLETADFVRFWAYIEPHKKVLEEAVPVHFFDAIRRFIICVVGLTHRSLPRELLASFLGLAEADAELDTCIASAKATVADGNVLFPAPTIVYKQNNFSAPDLASAEQKAKIMNALTHQ